MARKTKEEMPYSSVSGVCSCSRACASHCGCSAALSMLNRAVPSSATGASTLCSVRTTSAVGLDLRRKASTAPSCVSVTRSHLVDGCRQAREGV